MIQGHIRTESTGSQVGGKSSPGPGIPFFRRVFLPFALGYFLSQLFRSVNAVVSADLIRELALDAWTVGFLTSAYFLAFAGAQIPVGVALDRFGPRRTESLLLLFAAAGSLLFATAGGTWGLILGRGLIGLGVAACLMASFHAFVVWGSPGKLPLLNGAVMAVGALGALSATAPVEWAVSAVGWRALFLSLSAATLASAWLLHLLAPKPREREAESWREVARGVGRVYRSRAFWSIAPLSITHQGSFLAIQSLWAGPWLRDVAGLGREEVASQLLTLALGMAIGFLGLGWAAERLGPRGISPLAMWLAAAVVFQMVQGAIAAGRVDHARLLWFAFGLFGASGMFGYVILTRRFHPSLAGRVNAGLNVLVFTGAFALQAGIGAVIDALSAEGAFSPEGYRLAFAGALALQVLCLLWLFATTAWRRSDSG